MTEGFIVNEKTLRVLKASLAFILIFIIGVVSAQDTRKILDGLDTYIEKARKDWNIPGIAVGIVKDDALIFAKGYGVRELDKSDKIDKNTLIPVYILIH